MSAIVKHRMLPDSWVEKIFGHMEGLYGSKFSNLWRGTDLDKVKALWAEKLGPFMARPEAIKQALNALDSQPYPPTLPEFLELCIQASRRIGEAQHKRISYTPSEEERERHKQMARQATAAASGDKDPMEWVRHPRSKGAFAMALDCARAGDQRVKRILAGLVEQGVCNAEFHLLKAWNGNDWVRA